MPDKPEETPSKGPGPKVRRRGWFRRLLKWFGIFLLVLAIFHRPLFHTAVRFALIQVASKQNVKLDVHFAGTIFTNLIVRDVQAVPNGKGPSPVERISIESVRLDYSIVNLIKHGVGEFLRSYELKNADLVFQPSPSKTKAETEQKKTLAEDLNNLLGQPALYADAVNIDNLSITIHGVDSTTEVKGVRLYLHPWDPGYLKIDRIAAPGLPAWEHIDAKTSYVKRNLFIQNLVLSPELVITEYNFDASQRSQDKGSMLLKAALFGGNLQLGLSGSKLKEKGENLDKSYDTALNLDVSAIDVKAAAKYFGAKEPPLDRLAWLKVAFKGEPEKPKTWNGDASLRAEGFAAGQARIDGVETYLHFAQGLATMTGTKIAMGPSTIGLKAITVLPDSVNDFAKSEGDADVTIDAPDLAALTGPFLTPTRSELKPEELGPPAPEPKPVEPIGGTLSGGGKVSLHKHVVSADFLLSGAKIGNKGFGVGTMTVKLTATKLLDQPAGAAAFDGLDSQASVRAQDLNFSSFTVDSVAVDAQTHNEFVTLTTAEVARDQNHVSAKGTYRLPRTPGAPAPIDAEFAIKAPQLETFRLGKPDTYSASMRENILTGHLDLTGKVSSVNDEYNGSVVIDGGDFQFGDFKAARLAGKVDVVKDEAQIEQIALQFNATDKIGLAGKVGLKEPMNYEAAGLVFFKDVAVLQPLLATFGVKEKIDGGLDFSTEVQGKLKPQEHMGKVELTVNKAHYGKFELTNLRLATLFGSDFLESSEFHVATGPTSIDGKLEWRDKKAKLKDISLMQGSQQALTGYILVPLDPANKEQPVSFTERLGVNVNAKDLDIAKLMETLGQKAPVTGTVSMNMLVAGTVLKPIAHLKVNARNLKSPAAAKFDGAEVDLTAHYSEKELTLDAAARQREIKPLVIKGRVPLDLEATMEKKALDPNLPIDLTVNLPPSSLAFVPKLAPVVRSISGTAGINGHVGGTIGKPVMTGGADIKIEYARLTNGNVPNIGQFVLSLGFTEDHVKINRIHGDLGGGTFDVAGGIALPKLTEPVFDLRIRSDKILVRRDDAITVRVDTDLTIGGPMAAGKIAGTVWVTQSRFFKEIDILPIALPGRPKPKPQPKAVAASGPATISLPPPLDKWTFDIAVKTRPNDLFLVRGNMANGAAAVDLKFGGTGAEPYLEGMVRVENLVASLPFSKLNITRGFITFSRDEILQPKLDIQAESQIREYHLNVYIYGPANDPKVSLTSEPPLPQQDLLSLLATGTTISELTGSSDVLASRAASLLFQQLYRKVFKNKSPASNVPVLNRFEVESGSVDSRTGSQAIAASFKMNDNLYLLGNVDVTGEFIGRVRYLLRFR